MKLFVYILAIIAGSVLSFESAIYGKLGENGTEPLEWELNKNTLF
ncbi:hypothetical protein [Staphylococcus xylosus]